jgi:hypothetical protein
MKEENAISLFCKDTEKPIFTGGALLFIVWEPTHMKAAGRFCSAQQCWQEDSRF